jgi:hypothetical protein
LFEPSLSENHLEMRTIFSGKDHRKKISDPTEYSMNPGDFLSPAGGRVVQMVQKFGSSVIFSTVV